MFARRHYVFISQVLRDARPEKEFSSEYDLWVKIWTKFEYQFRIDDPNFDYVRFRQMLYGQQHPDTLIIL